MLTLLEGADIKFKRSHRLDIALCTNMPVAIVFLPASDIPRFVGEGRCALGITGTDQVAESGVEVVEHLNLGFGNCKLHVQVAANGMFTDPTELIGKTIVTSYVNLTREYFQTLEGKQPGEELATTIKRLSGSVEAAIPLGVGDGIVDLVESGDTMRAAGLKPIGTVITTSATLIGSIHPTHMETLQLIKHRLTGVLATNKYVLCTYNAPRTALPTLLKITPGRRAPSVTPLDDDDWVAVSSMVEKDNVASIMDQLTANQATDVIVLQISNCRV